MRNKGGRMGDQKAFPQENIHHIDSFEDIKENRFEFCDTRIIHNDVSYTS